MSHTALLCPFCMAPVPLRLRQPIGRVARYTCPFCGEMTLHSELVRETHLSRADMVGFGGLTGLVGTLVVAAPNQSFPLMGSNAGTPPELSLVTFAWLNCSTVASPYISHIVIRATATVREPSSQGPEMPTLQFRWREETVGGGGSIAATAIPFGSASLLSVAVTKSFTSDAITTKPSGGAWTQAALDDLQVGMDINCNSNGSGVATEIDLTTMSVEVWR